MKIDKLCYETKLSGSSQVETLPKIAIVNDEASVREPLASPLDGHRLDPAVMESQPIQPRIVPQHKRNTQNLRLAQLNRRYRMSTSYATRHIARLWRRHSSMIGFSGSLQTIGPSADQCTSTISLVFLSRN